MSERKDKLEGVHLGSEQPHLLNAVNETLPKQRFTAYTTGMDAQGMSHLSVKGHVEAVDLAQAHAVAGDKWGAQAYDYLKPVEIGRVEKLPKMSEEG